MYSISLLFGNAEFSVSEPPLCLQHDAFDEEQGEAEELLDNAALLMLQASTTHTANVKRALWLGAIGLGLSGADAEVERIERGALAAYDQRAVV